MSQRLIAWIVIAVAAALLIALAVFFVRGQTHRAVQEDRAVSAADRAKAQVAAERAAQADAEQDKLVADRARAQQMEAINESMHEPGGDPAAAVYDRLRRQSAPAR